MSYTRVLAIGVAIGAAQAVAQPPARSLSLGDAVRVALTQSEALAIAQAGVTRARGQVMQARSEFWPQLYGTAGYTRTLKSQYASLASSSAFGPPPSSRDFQLCTIQLDSNATTAQRQAALAAAQTCPAAFSGNIFSNVGFGSLNAYNIGLSFSQAIFNGQFLAAQRAASAPRQAADVEVAAQRAQVIYDVAQAYYDAALADALVSIADSTLAQNERTLGQARLARRVGTQSEYDLLQTQVTRDNQVPVLVQARNDRDQRYYRLKQLIKMPLDAPLELTTTVEDSTDLPGGVRLVSLTDSTPAVIGDTVAEHRSSVREQGYAIVEYKALVSQARAEYLPILTLSSDYSRVAYPFGGLPAWNNFLTNWTIGLTASVPIFNGFKTHGDVLIAQANLKEQQARLTQAHDLAALDARTTIADLRAAEASWAAVSTSWRQAVQAYQIAEIRYQQGLSTLVELNASSIAKQQSFSNRAQSARNLQVARVKAALIRDLPVSAGGAGASAAPSAQQQAQNAQQRPQSQTQTPILGTGQFNPAYGLPISQASPGIPGQPTP